MQGGTRIFNASLSLSLLENKMQSMKRQNHLLGKAFRYVRWVAMPVCVGKKRKKRREVTLEASQVIYNLTRSLVPIRANKVNRNQ